MTSLLAPAALVLLLSDTPAGAGPCAADTIVTYDLPPYVSGLVRRSFDACRTGTRSTETVLARLRTLPGVHDLRTRGVTSRGSRYLQVFGRHRRSLTIRPAPRSRPGRALEAGAGLTIDGSLRMGDRLTARFWQDRSGDTKNPVQSEFTLMLPLLRSKLLSAGAVVGFGTMVSAVAALRLGPICPGSRPEFALFAGSGEAPFAGAILRIERPAAAAAFGLHGTGIRAAGTRVYLAAARGSWEASIRGGWSTARSTLLPPASRAVWAHGRAADSDGSRCFASAAIGRVLVRTGEPAARRPRANASGEFRLTSTIEIMHRGGIAFLVPALTASARPFAQDLAAAVASRDGIMLLFRWNAWPGGSGDLGRADRLMRELRSVTGDETRRSLRRW